MLWFRAETGRARLLPFALAGEVCSFPQLAFFFKDNNKVSCAPLLLFAISPYQHPNIFVTGAIKGKKQGADVCVSAHCEEGSSAAGLPRGARMTQKGKGVSQAEDSIW